MRGWTPWSRRLPCLALLAVCAAASADDGAWSFAIDHGVERSTRSYLLVADAGQPSQRAVRVRSVCRKPRETEGAYGQCAHTIYIVPAPAFRLDSGEDVTVVEGKWGAPLLLATLQYGCCGGPWTARFHDARGRYLGTLEGLGSTAVGDNAITRRQDFHNRTVTRSGADYLLVHGEGAREPLAELRVLTLRPDGSSARPLHLAAGDLGSCEAWYVAGFDAFADRDDVVLKIAGGPCNAEPSEKRYACRERGEAFECAALSASTTTPR